MARTLVKIEERRFVDLAAEVLADHRSEAGYTYSGFCMTSLPHRSIPDEQEWRRPGERFTLVIEPGALYDAEGNRSQLLGVPYGPKADSYCYTCNRRQFEQAAKKWNSDVP